MYHASAQDIDERIINVHYYYYLCGFSRPCFSHQHNDLMLGHHVHELGLVFPHRKLAALVEQLIVSRCERQSCGHPKLITYTSTDSKKKKELIILFLTVSREQFKHNCKTVCLSANISIHYLCLLVH